MRAAVFLVADAVSVDAQGKLNALGVFQAIEVPSLPWTYANVGIIAVLEFEREEAPVNRIGFKVTTPDGLTPVNAELAVPDQPPLLEDESVMVAQFAINLNVFQLNHPGWYEVSLDCGDARTAATRFKVKVSR